MTDELKPCPFCGAKAQFRSVSFSDGLVRVCCSICTASSDFYPNNDYPSAAKYWNTRPIEDALSAELAAAKSVLADVMNAVWTSVKGENSLHHNSCMHPFGQCSCGAYSIIDSARAVLAATAPPTEGSA